MKTKSSDKMYCGVDQKRITEAQPTLDWTRMVYFKDFMIERYRIHKRKDVLKESAPWTKNSILQEYKFTNIRREHDRQTRYLLKNITHNSSLTLEDKVVNSFMFRSWNNWSTLQDFGFPYTAEEIYDFNLREKVRPIYHELLEEDPERHWWSNAYNQGGTKAAWKFPAGDGYERAYKESDAMRYQDWEKDIPLRPFHVGCWLGVKHIYAMLIKCKDQQECFDIIRSIRGFADFLAYQVFVDLSYIEDFPFSENEFVVAGPGCKKGLDLIFKDKDGMTYEDCIFWLRNAVNSEDSIFNSEQLHKKEFEIHKKNRSYRPERLFDDLPEYDRQTNVMSLENCMCELSKYVRAVERTGRPRNKYHGGNNNE